MNNLIIKFSDRTGSRIITGTIDKVIMHSNGMFSVFPTGMGRELKYETTLTTDIIIEPLIEDEFRKYSW